MVDGQPNAKRKPPGGGKPKGGARYPRYGLKECCEWAKKLVGKTHNGSQPADIIYASVVDSKGPRGEIKASALKQFCLMDGPKEAYIATPLAKKLAVAPAEESSALMVQAVLAPPLFRSLFETFHGDTVTQAKLRQRAAELNVHLDNLDQAISIYGASLALAGLVTIDGDRITHKTASAAIDSEKLHDTPEVDEAQEDQEPGGNDEQNASDVDHGQSPRAIFHVNVNLDASLDSDKLEKHLALLKRYGAI